MKITVTDILEAQKKTRYELCRGVFGFQTDFQCTGYDHLCALAMLEEGDSYQRIRKAKEKIKSNPYYTGFQQGWDGVQVSSLLGITEDGYHDGKDAVEMLGDWECYKRPEDVCDR